MQTTFDKTTEENYSVHPLKLSREAFSYTNDDKDCAEGFARSCAVMIPIN